MNLVKSPGYKGAGIKDDHTQTGKVKERKIELSLYVGFASSTQRFSLML